MMAEMSPFMKMVVADYFRPERPPLSVCYRRAVRVAHVTGWFVPSVSTVGLAVKELARGTEFRDCRSASAVSAQLSVSIASVR